MTAEQVARAQAAALELQERQSFWSHVGYAAVVLGVAMFGAYAVGFTQFYKFSERFPLLLGVVAFGVATAAATNGGPGFVKLFHWNLKPGSDLHNARAIGVIICLICAAILGVMLANAEPW